MFKPFRGQKRRLNPQAQRATGGRRSLRGYGYALGQAGGPNRPCLREEVWSKQSYYLRDLTRVFKAEPRAAGEELGRIAVAEVAEEV